MDDGEHYLVRLYAKTGTAIDQDLRKLFERGLRRVRRVLSSRRARETLVEVIEMLEDERELAIVMLDPGAPLLSSPRGMLARRQLCSTNVGRAMFWQNISRVIEALAHCHDAGIVHGAIDEHAIFARGDDDPNYRLGGYEACVHIADSDPDPSGAALRRSEPISFRRDLADVAAVVNVVLGLDQPGAPTLSSIKRRMLGRMANPPHHQAYDGHVALEDLTEVIEELERSGAGVEGEMILYPGAEALRVDLPTLTLGMISAEDSDAVTRFIADDLSSVDIRMIVGPSRGLRIVTDLAIYDVELVEPRIGMITHGAKRRPHDRVNEALCANDVETNSTRKFILEIVRIRSCRSQP